MQGNTFGEHVRALPCVQGITLGTRVGDPLHSEGHTHAPQMCLFTSQDGETQQLWYQVLYTITSILGPYGGGPRLPLRTEPLPGQALLILVNSSIRISVCIRIRTNTCIRVCIRDCIRLSIVFVFGFIFACVLGFLFTRS